MLVLAADIERAFGGLKRGVSARDVVYALCRADDTEFSWRNFTLAEREGNVVAGLCAYRAEDCPAMTQCLPAHLQKDCGIGAGGLIKLLFRSLWHSLAARALLKPPGSLYILLGGVFPACQRTGVARSTLEYLFDRARTEGFQQVALHVERTNRPAISLYTSLRFQEAPAPATAPKVLMTLSLR